MRINDPLVRPTDTAHSREGLRLCQPTRGGGVFSHTRILGGQGGVSLLPLNKRDPIWGVTGSLRCTQEVGSSF